MDGRKSASLRDTGRASSRDLGSRPGLQRTRIGRRNRHDRNRGIRHGLRGNGDVARSGSNWSSGRTAGKSGANRNRRIVRRGDANWSSGSTGSTGKPVRLAIRNSEGTATEGNGGFANVDGSGSSVGTWDGGRAMTDGRVLDGCSGRNGGFYGIGGLALSRARSSLSGTLGSLSSALSTDRHVSGRSGRDERFASVGEMALSRALSGLGSTLSSGIWSSDNRSGGGFSSAGRTLSSLGRTLSTLSSGTWSSS
jgi:hypothetical protein